jgi:hypothetical protein
MPHPIGDILKAFARITGHWPARAMEAAQRLVSSRYA